MINKDGVKTVIQDGKKHQVHYPKFKECQQLISSQILNLALRDKKEWVKTAIQNTEEMLNLLKLLMEAMELLLINSQILSHAQKDSIDTMEATNVIQRDINSLKVCQLSISSQILNLAQKALKEWVKIVIQNGEEIINLPKSQMETMELFQTISQILNHAQKVNTDTMEVINAIQRATYSHKMSLLTNSQTSSHAQRVNIDIMEAINAIQRVTNLLKALKNFLKFLITHLI